MTEPKSLDFNSLKRKKTNEELTPQNHVAETEVKLWPSRSVLKSSTGPVKPEMENLTVRMKSDLALSFRKLCETERRTYGGMLEELINAYVK